MSGLPQYTQLNKLSPLVKKYISDPTRANPMVRQLLQHALGDFGRMSEDAASDPRVQLMGQASNITVPVVSIPRDEKGQPIYPGEFSLVYRNTRPGGVQSTAISLCYDPHSNVVPEDLKSKLRASGFTMGTRTAGNSKDLLFFLRLQKIDQEQNLDPNVIFTNTGFSASELANPTPAVQSRLADATAYLDKIGVSIEQVQQADPSLSRASIINALINKVAADMGMLIEQKPMSQSINYEASYLNSDQIHSMLEAEHRSTPVFCAPKNLNPSDPSKHFVSFAIPEEYLPFQKQILEMVEYAMTMQLDAHGQAAEKKFAFDPNEHLWDVHVLKGPNGEILEQLYGDNWLENEKQVEKFIQRETERRGYAPGQLSVAKTKSLHIFAGDADPDMKIRSMDSLLPRFMTNARGLVYAPVNIRLLRHPSILHPKANTVYQKFSANDLIAVEVGLSDINYRHLLRNRLAQALSIVDDISLSSAVAIIDSRLNTEARPEHFVFHGKDRPFLEAALGQLLDPSANLNLDNPINAKVDEEHLRREINLGRVKSPMYITDYAITTSTYRYLTGPIVAAALSHTEIMDWIGIERIIDAGIEKIRSTMDVIDRNPHTTEAVIREIIAEGIATGKSAPRRGGMAFSGTGVHPRDTVGGYAMKTNNFTFKTFEAVNGGNGVTAAWNTAHLLQEAVERNGLDDPNVVFQKRSIQQPNDQQETTPIARLEASHIAADLTEEKLQEINELPYAELQQLARDEEACPYGSALRDAVMTRSRAIEEEIRQAKVQSIFGVWKNSSQDLSKNVYIQSKGVSDLASARHDPQTGNLLLAMVKPSLGEKGEANYNLAAMQTINSKGDKLYAGPSGGALHHISGPRPHDSEARVVIVGEGAATAGLVAKVAQDAGDIDPSTSVIGTSNASNTMPVLESIVSLRAAQNSPIQNLIVAADYDAKYPEQRARQFTGLNHANNTGMLTSLLSMANILEHYPNAVENLYITHPQINPEDVAALYQGQNGRLHYPSGGIPTDFGDIDYDAALSDYSSNKMKLESPYQAYKEALKYCGTGGVFTIDGQPVTKTNKKGEEKYIEYQFNKNTIADIMRNMLRLKINEFESREGREPTTSEFSEIFRSVLDDAHEIHGQPIFHVDPVMTAVAGYKHRIEGFSDETAEEKHESQAALLGTRLVNSVQRRSIQEQTEKRGDISVVQTTIDGVNRGVILSVHSQAKLDESLPAIEKALGDDFGLLEKDEARGIYTFPVDNEALTRVSAKLSSMALTPPMIAKPVASTDPERSYDIQIEGYIKGIKSDVPAARNKSVEMTLADFIDRHKLQMSSTDFKYDPESGHVKFSMPPSKLSRFVGDVRNAFSSRGASAKAVTYRADYLGLQISHQHFDEPRESEMLISGEVSSDTVSAFLKNKLTAMGLIDGQEINGREVTLAIPFSSWDALRTSLVEQFPEYDIESLIERGDERSIELERNNPRVLVRSKFTPEGRDISKLLPQDILDNANFSSTPLVKENELEGLSGALEKRLDRKAALEKEKEDRRAQREAEKAAKAAQSQEGLDDAGVDEVAPLDESAPEEAHEVIDEPALVVVPASVSGITRLPNIIEADRAYDDLIASKERVAKFAESPILAEYSQSDRDLVANAAAVLSDRDGYSSADLIGMGYSLTPGQLLSAIRAQETSASIKVENDIDMETATIANLGLADAFDIHQLAQESYRVLSEEISKEERTGLKESKAALQMIATSFNDPAAANKNYIGLPEDVKSAISKAWGALQESRDIPAMGSKPDYDDMIIHAQKLFAATAIALGRSVSSDNKEMLSSTAIAALESSKSMDIPAGIVKELLNNTWSSAASYSTGNSCLESIKKAVADDLAAIAKIATLSIEDVADSAINFMGSQEFLENGLNIGVNPYAMAAMRGMMNSPLLRDVPQDRIESALWSRLAVLAADAEPASTEITKMFAAISELTGSGPSGSVGAEIYSKLDHSSLPAGLRTDSVKEWMSELSCFRPNKFKGEVAKSLGLPASSINVKTNEDSSKPFSIIHAQSGVLLKEGTVSELVFEGYKSSHLSISDDAVGAWKGFSAQGAAENESLLVYAYSDGRVISLDVNPRNVFTDDLGNWIVPLGMDSEVIVASSSAEQLADPSSNPVAIMDSITLLEDPSTPPIVKGQIAKAFYSAGMLDIESIKKDLSALPKEVEAFLDGNEVTYRRFGQDLEAKGLGIANSITALPAKEPQNSLILTADKQIINAFVTGTYMVDGVRVVEYTDPETLEDHTVENATYMDIKDADRDAFQSTLNERFGEFISSLDAGGIVDEIMTKALQGGLQDAAVGHLVKETVNEHLQRDARIMSTKGSAMGINYRFADGQAQLLPKGFDQPVATGSISSIQKMAESSSPEYIQSIADGYRNIPDVINLSGAKVALGADSSSYESSDYLAEEFAPSAEIIRSSEFVSLSKGSSISSAASIAGTQVSIEGEGDQKASILGYYPGTGGEKLYLAAMTNDSGDGNVSASYLMIHQSGEGDTATFTIPGEHNIVSQEFGNDIKSLITLHDDALAKSQSMDEEMQELMKKKAPSMSR